MAPIPPPFQYLYPLPHSVLVPTLSDFKPNSGTYFLLGVTVIVAYRVKKSDYSVASLALTLCRKVRVNVLKHGRCGLWPSRAGREHPKLGGRQ